MLENNLVSPAVAATAPTRPAADRPSALAALRAEARETIEYVYEPYLVQSGYLARTPRGRVATEQAWALVAPDRRPPKPEGSLF